MNTTDNNNYKCFSLKKADYKIIQNQTFSFSSLNETNNKPVVL